MGLTQREMACFTGNNQFLNEVAAALLPIAAGMIKAAMVVESTPESTAVEKAFAATRRRLGEQILAEQGISVQASVNPFGGGAAQASGSTAMKYLVQQLLLSSAWTLTPDEWASDELAARTTIQTQLAALLNALTAIPTA